MYACLKIEGNLLKPALGGQTMQRCLCWHLPSCLQRNACLKIQSEKQRIKGLCHHLKPHFMRLQEQEQSNEILTEGATASFHSAASQDALLCTAHQPLNPGTSCSKATTGDNRHLATSGDNQQKLGTSRALLRALRHSNSCRNTISVLSPTKNFSQG